MVSSLPFLAPVFLRKAKEYRTKHTHGYGSSGSRSRRIGKGSQLYKLSSLSKNGEAESSTVGNTGDKGTTAYVTGGFDKHSTSGSEEDILKKGNVTDDRITPQHDPNSIVKSITYSVRVDDGTSSGERARYNAML